MSRLPAITTLDDVRTLLAALPGPDETAREKAAEREPQLTKPPGSLGRLEELSHWMCAWSGEHPPTLKRPRAHVFAGNHGVVAQGVSAYPSEVTVQMVANFKHGGAAVNQLCAAMGAELGVEEMDLANPTKDFTQAPAMEDEECASAIAFGMKVVENDSDVVCLGEMGIGNTTSAAAICHALYGGMAHDWVGPGTGVQGSALDAKTRVVADGVAKHKAAMTDGLEILRHVGGRELAAIAGAVIGARLKRVPVLLDGYVSTAAAAPLAAMLPGALDHCQVGHVSAEPAHCHLLERLGKKALLDFNMRLGEGSGAVLALGVLKGAVACHTGMATFAQAGVSDKD